MRYGTLTARRAATTAKPTTSAVARRRGCHGALEAVGGARGDLARRPSRAAQRGDGLVDLGEQRLGGRPAVADHLAADEVVRLDRGRAS
jgi:hypothetical protein